MLKWCAKWEKNRLSAPFQHIFFLFPTSCSMKQFDHSLHSIQEQSLEKVAQV